MTRKTYWYNRGRKDAIDGKDFLCFDNAPAHWTLEDELDAKDAYEAGFNDGLYAIFD